MRQLIQDLRSGAVELVELPDPTPKRHEVMVRTRWSVISPGTEQAVSETASKSLIGKALDRPDQARRVVEKAVQDGPSAALSAVRARLDDVLTPGYSSMGVIEGVGADVDGLSVGQIVGCVGANAATHAELATVPAPLCLALPPGLDERWAAFGAVGGIAAHGVRLAGIDAGSVVAVIGLGLIGQLAAQLVTAAGGRAIGVDISPQRVELARRLGAVAGSTGSPEEVDRLVRSVSGGYGADAVVLTAATKDSGPLRTAAEIARDRATISVVGDVGLDVPRGPFYEKELELRVSRSYGPGRYDPEYEEQGHDYPIGFVRWPERRLIGYFFDEVAAGRVRLDELVSHEFDIERGEDAYAALAEPGRMAILLRYRPPRNDAAVSRVPVQEQGAAAPVTPGPERPRVGLLGPGLFARATLLPQLARLPVELAAVVAPSSARAFGVGRRWGARYVASSAAEVIADPEIDAVIVATRHDSHAPLAAEALRAGKAVFLEKPLAIQEQELDELEPLLRGGGKLVLDLNRSLAPATRRVIEHFAVGSEPLSLTYRVNAGFVETSDWTRDPAVGGGRLVGEGCHFVDLCSTIVGKPLVAVDADSLGEGAGTLRGDNFVLRLRYADGSIATIAYIASGSRRMSKERIEIIGRGRSAVIDDFRRVELYGGGRTQRTRGFPTQDKGHAAILDASFAFFRRGDQPPIPYDRLLETTRATFRARAALDAA